MKYRMSGEVAGGERAGGIGPILYRTTPMSNHDISDSVADRRADFEELTKLLLARVARDMLDTIPPSQRTTEQTQFLQDVVRGRRNVTLLSQLLALAPRAQNPTLLAESVHGAIIQTLPTPATCAVDAYLDDVRSDAAADVAKAQFLVERTSTRRDACIQAVTANIDKLRAFLNLLHVWPSRNAA